MVRAAVKRMHYPMYRKDWRWTWEIDWEVIVAAPVKDADNLNFIVSSC